MNLLRKSSESKQIQWSKWRSGVHRAHSNPIMAMYGFGVQNKILEMLYAWDLGRHLKGLWGSLHSRACIKLPKRNLAIDQTQSGQGLYSTATPMSGFSPPSSPWLERVFPWDPSMLRKKQDSTQKHKKFRTRAKEVNTSMLKCSTCMHHQTDQTANPPQRPATEDTSKRTEGHMREGFSRCMGHLPPWSYPPVGNGDHRNRCIQKTGRAKHF